MPKSVLFVCLGNICRSPIAEAILKQLVSDRGQASEWEIDSAATSTYQIGSSPDSRGRACMERHGIYKHVKDHRAKQIRKEDFKKFDFIFGMDNSNMSDLNRMAPKTGSTAKLQNLGDFDTDKRYRGTIEDPYFTTNDQEFDRVYEQCLRSCAHFLDSM